MKALDLCGIIPALTTPLTRDGRIDHQAVKRLDFWLSSVRGVKDLVVLGYTGEGIFLTQQEQAGVIRSFVGLIRGRVSIITGITDEGTEVAVLGAQCAVDTSASAGLLYPSHGWLRFGHQKETLQDHYRVVYEESGPSFIPFQCPGVTRATYNLEATLDISVQPRVFAMKNSVWNIRRWDMEIPAIRCERPDLQILDCHDKYLPHTAFGIDDSPVGYGNTAPGLLLEPLGAGKTQDYVRAKAVHDRLLPIIKAVYRRGLYMGGTVALRYALVERGILEHVIVCSPLLPLRPGAGEEIKATIRKVGIKKAVI